MALSTLLLVSLPVVAVAQQSEGGVQAGAEEGEWAPDPNVTRLFFGPTGRSLASGTGYIGLFELFFVFAAYGVGDRVVVAGGTPLIPEVAGRLLYVAPKVRVASRDRLDVSVGAIAAFMTEALDQGSVGLVYAVGTHGTPEKAITAGAGWGFQLGTGEDALLSNDPVFLLGGELRTGRDAKLITENYFAFIDGLQGVVSGGIRFLGERFSADLGVGGLVGRDAVCCLPVLSAVYAF